MAFPSFTAMSVVLAKELMALVKLCDQNRI